MARRIEGRFAVVCVEFVFRSRWDDTPVHDV
jgi:hypothetical protein